MLSFFLSRTSKILQIRLSDIVSFSFLSTFAPPTRQISMFYREQYLPHTSLRAMFLLFLFWEPVVRHPVATKCSVFFSGVWLICGVVLIVNLLKVKLFLYMYLSKNQTINNDLINQPLRTLQKDMIGTYCLIFSIFLWSTDF